MSGDAYCTPSSVKAGGYLDVVKEVGLEPAIKLEKYTFRLAYYARSIS